MRQPATIAQPAVKGLLERAVKAVDYPGATPLEFYSFMRNNIGRSDIGTFVGFADGVPRIICIGLLPTTVFTFLPQIVFVYNEGSKALAKAVGVRVRAWLRDNGFDEALAVNMLHKPDAFARVFSHFGEPKSFAEVVRFILS